MRTNNKTNPIPNILKLISNLFTEILADYDKFARLPDSKMNACCEIKNKIINLKR